MAGRFMDEMPGMRFGHAGTIVEGKADTAAEKIARLQDAGISVAEEIADIPELVKSEAREGGDRLMPGMFIDVEVDDSTASEPDIAKKLADVCPVDIFAERRRQRSRSSRRTSTSACSAGSASTPRRRAPCA